MCRITNILQNRPNMLGQTQHHRRATILQRAMNLRPIVQIPPQPQCPLQHANQPRDVASTSGQTRLLVSQCPVQSLQMKSIYLAADTRSPNTILDVFEATEQSSGSNLQQVASGIADLPAVCLAGETNNSSAKKPFCFEIYIIVCQYHEVLHKTGIIH